jgi:ribosome-associated heat shock protein Hsp15
VALRQRLDKWLWFARVARTRSLAARLVAGGHVRLNARRIETPAKGVGPGDVLTIALERQVRVLKVVAPGARRAALPKRLACSRNCRTRGFAPCPALPTVQFKT